MKNSTLKNIFCFLCTFIFIIYYGYSQTGITLEEDSFSALGEKYFAYSDRKGISYDSVLIYTQIAADYFQKAQNWEKYIFALGAIGGAFYQLDNDQKAKEYYLKALRIAEERQIEIHPTVLNGLAITVYKIRGQYDQAISIFFKAIELLKNGNYPEGYLPYFYENIGFTYMQKGDFIQAEKYLKEAYKDDERYYDSKIKVINKLASCYRQMGQIDRAIALLQKNNNTLRHKVLNESTHKRLIENFSQLGDLYLQKGRTDSTRYFIRKALALQTEDNSLEKNYSYEILGRLALLENKPQLAISHFKEALRLSHIEHAIFPFHSEIAENYQYLAEIYASLGDCEASLAYYQKALSALCPDQSGSVVPGNPTPDQFIDPKTGLEILRSKAEKLQGFTNSGKGDYSHAVLDTYETAIATIRQVRRSFHSQKAKQLLAGESLPVFEGAIAVCWNLYHKTGQSVYLEKMYSFAEGNKANLLLERLQETNARGQTILPDSTLLMERQLITDIIYYEKKIREAKYKGNIDQGVLENWRTTVLRLEQEYDAFQRNLEKDHPNFFNLKYGYELASANQIQHQLPNDETVMLHYFIGENSSFLFLLTKDELQVFPIYYNRRTQEQIQTLRNICSTYPESQDFLQKCQHFAESGFALYQTLLKPVEDQLVTNQLIIIPDDQLHYLPFSLLVSTLVENPQNFSTDTFDYLLENFVLSYAYSGTLFVQSLVSKTEKPEAVWVGYAPSFRGAQSLANRGCQLNNLYSLQCSQPEVESIQRLLGGKVFLSGDRINILLWKKPKSIESFT